MIWKWFGERLTREQRRRRIELGQTWTAWQEIGALIQRVLVVMLMLRPIGKGLAFLYDFGLDSIGGHGWLYLSPKMDPEWRRCLSCGIERNTPPWVRRMNSREGPQ